jgi:hypothetical protein
VYAIILAMVKELTNQVVVHMEQAALLQTIHDNGWHMGPTVLMWPNYDSNILLTKISLFQGHVCRQGCSRCGWA